MKNESSLRARTASWMWDDPQRTHRPPEPSPWTQAPTPWLAKAAHPTLCTTPCSSQGWLGALWPQRALSTTHLFSARSLISPLDHLWDFSQRWQLCFISSSSSAAAAAKSLQSRPTLCNPTDGSPPGSPISGILQARTLEWVAISLSNAWKWKVKSEREVAQSCPTLSDPVDCSLPSSSHGICQARVLEWVAIAFSSSSQRQ